MTSMHLPWLELAIFVSMAGGLWVGRLPQAVTARTACLWFSGIVLACTLGAWIDFISLGTLAAHDPWDLSARLVGRRFLVIDTLNAPLLPLVALLHFLTALTTLPTKIRRYSFAWALISEGIMLATLICTEPWGIIGLLAAGTVPPWLELQARGKSARVFVWHMALFVGLLVFGWAAVEAEGRQRIHTLWAVVPLMAAIFVRSGMVPVHCWMTDLFEHATFGTALLFVTPIVPVYAAIRLVLPIAPDWLLQGMGLISLTTAVYSAGMAMIQREARRFFCYLFLSHSALVFVGLETATPIGLTGALCMWLSIGLSLGGFGLTLRALESRRGRLSLTVFHGGYEHTPALAVCFLLTGLASVGFPGTFGFIGTEMLVDGAVQSFPYVGVAVVVAAAFNGIAVVQAYFRLFTGTRHHSSVSLRIRGRERFAVLALAALILLLGLYPQPNVASRYQAAIEVLRERGLSLPSAIVHADTGSHGG